MDQQHIGRYLSLSAFALVAVALAGCDNGSVGPGGTGASATTTTGTGKSTTTSGSPTSTTTSGTTTSGGGSTTSASTGTSSGAAGLPLEMGGYLKIDSTAGGYAFAYSDSTNPPPQPEGTSTATLATDSFCISGSVGLVGTMGGTMDFTDDWGCGIGVNLDQAMATTPTMPPIDALQLTGTSITVSTSGVPTCTTARINLDDNGTAYCAALTDGQPVDYTDFNTECWAPTMGTPMAGAPSSKALKIQFVTSGSSTTPCAFTDFCITGITLSP
jgi:hypothetical protein